VLKSFSGKLIFPVAGRRTDRALKDENIDAPEALPELVDTSDDEDDAASLAYEESAKAEFSYYPAPPRGITSRNDGDTCEGGVPGARKRHTGRRKRTLRGWGGSLNI
jgi:hypothetical protein